MLWQLVRGTTTRIHCVPEKSGNYIGLTKYVLAYCAALEPLACTYLEINMASFAKLASRGRKSKPLRILPPCINGINYFFT